MMQKPMRKQSIFMGPRRLVSLLHGNSWRVFLFFVLLVFLFRLSSFYQSVLDWDESLYLLMAKAWLQGNLPYTTIWDNKPPGIYALFLIALRVFGDSVVSIRILACLFVATSCFCLYKIGSLIENNGKAIGVIAGILYAIVTLNNGGLAANTEIFFAPFVLVAFYLFFKTDFRRAKTFTGLLLPLFVCGLFLGIGFEIKYVVLFDWLALSVMLAFVFFTQRSHNVKPVQILSAFLSLLIGFLLPFAIVSIYFWAHGNFAGYMEANYAANRLRTVQLEFSLLSAIKAFYWQFLIERFFWLSIPSAIIYLIFVRPIPSRERFIVFGFLVSFVCVLLGIAGVFRVSFNNHYFLQLSPSYCFATAFILIRVIFSDISIQHSEVWRRSILLVVLPLLIATTNLFTALKSGIEYAYYRHVRGVARWNDIPGTIADYLKPRLHPKDYIFVVHDFPVIYYLTNARIPTRYAFPPFLIIQEDLPNITGIVPVKELQLILQKKPAYIVMRNSVATDAKNLGTNRSFFEKLSRSLAEDYSLDSRMRGYSIYGLKNSP